MKSHPKAKGMPALTATEYYRRRDRKLREEAQIRYEQKGTARLRSPNDSPIATTRTSPFSALFEAEVAAFRATLEALPYASDKEANTVRERLEAKLEVIRNWGLAAMHSKLSTRTGRREASRRTAVAAQTNVIHKLRKNLKDALDARARQESQPEEQLVSVQEVNWEILPPGIESLELTVRNYLRRVELRGRPTRQFDDSRLRVALLLEPTEAFVGRGEFTDYIVFGFSYSQAKLLENSRIGNAIYILRRDWTHLSGLTKVELLDRPTNIVRRLVHRGDWINRLLDELKVPKEVRASVLKQFDQAPAERPA